MGAGAGGSSLAVASAFLRELQRRTVTPALNELHMTLIFASPPPIPKGFLCVFQEPDTLDRRTAGVPPTVIALSGSEVLLF